MIYGPELLYLRKHLEAVRQQALDRMADLDYIEAAEVLLAAVRQVQMHLDRDAIDKYGLTFEEYRGVPS